MPPIVLKPPAAPTPREGDEELTIPQVEQISLFKELSSAPKLQSLPGTVILRRFKPGDVICRQGEPGWTAFYILKAEDLLELRRAQLKEATQPERVAALTASVTIRERQVEQIKTAQNSEELRHAATVHLAVPQPPRGLGRRLVKGLSRRLFGAAEQTTGKRPLYIPIDGPVDIDYEVREAAINEGELLGEMSCLYHTPRSATVVASRECFALEILRNVLDAMLTNRNKTFKERVDTTYRQRVLELHLRNVPLFCDLPKGAFDEFQEDLRDRAELISLAPGTMLCDEYEYPDSMYIIRSGFVKVMRNVSALLSADAIADWPSLRTQLLAGKDANAPAAQKKVWQLVPALVQEVVAGPSTALAQGMVVDVFNELIRNPALRTHAEFAEVLKTSGLAADAAALPAKPTKWAQHQQVRTFNRQLLAALYPKAITEQNKRAAAPRVIAYCSRGDVIGEIGLVYGRPRIATCIAYDHPDSKFGEVEVVRISAELFRDVVRKSPALKRALEETAREHRDDARAKLGQAPGDRRRPLVMTERFEDLGLFQGQHLMLIDLDRCTRCDECVRACVNSHDDERSRLFLDGPRIGKYLVPATCRQCKDPVCLIGCPVGSIHKGSTGQIVIEDWCIGCSRCAENCPYDAIQMHDLGLIRRSTPGWRYAAAPADDAWQKPHYADRSWTNGSTPFRHDRMFRDGLAAPAQGQEFCFRYDFAIASHVLRSTPAFQLQVHSLAPALAVWINGEQVTLQKATPDGKLKKDKGNEWNLEAALTGKTSKAPPAGAQAVLRAGHNLVAIRLTVPAKTSDMMLELGLYEIRAAEAPLGVAGEFTQEMVTRTAVVCDLCNSLPSQQPACVQVCPHDAAMRVDGRMEFPR